MSTRRTYDALARSIGNSSVLWGTTPITGLGAAPKRYSGPVSRLSVRLESRNHEFRDAATGIRHQIPSLWGFIHP